VRQLIPTVFLVAITVLSALNSFVLVRRGLRLSRENTRLRARLLAHGGGAGDGDATPAELAARMMMTLTDAAGPVMEAVNCARRQREAEGWSPTAAEQMSMILYMGGMARIVGPAMAAVYGDDPGDDDYSGPGEGEGDRSDAS
jgi:hypothetical protein